MLHLVSSFIHTCTVVKEERRICGKKATLVEQLKMQFLIVLHTQEMHDLAETVLFLILSLSVPLGKKFAL